MMDTEHLFQLKTSIYEQKNVFGHLLWTTNWLLLAMFVFDFWTHQKLSIDAA